MRENTHMLLLRHLIFTISFIAYDMLGEIKVIVNNSMASFLRKYLFSGPLISKSVETNFCLSDCNCCCFTDGKLAQIFWTEISKMYTKPGFRPE